MQRQIAPQTILETCRSKESLVARPGSIRSSIRAVSPRGQDPEVTATHSSHPFHSHGIAGDKKSKGKDKFNDTSDPAAVKLTVAKKPKSKNITKRESMDEVEVSKYATLPASAYAFLGAIRLAACGSHVALLGQSLKRVRHLPALFGFRWWFELC